MTGSVGSTRPRITRGFVFKSVFGDDPQKCQRLLELALGMPIAEVSITHTEHELDVLEDARAGRVDVFVRDIDGNEYDAEIQSRHGEDEWIRARHYQALMDADRLRKGAKVGDLRKCVVVFICDFDPFDRKGFSNEACGWKCYDCRTVCLQSGIVVPDGRQAVFLNARGTRGEVSPELDAFLRYVADEEVDGDAFVDDIKAKIDKLVVDRKWMEAYMTFEDELEAERLYGVEQGVEQSVEQNAQLAEVLKEAGRMGDYVAATTDLEYRNRLLAEFGIE